MKNKNKVIVISGPTATGKTSLGIEIAKKHNGEVINFDSLLFYKEISIGTAKPTKEEMDGITHHLVSVNSISTPLNASDFSKVCIPIIQDVLSRGKLPILSGGSGFYLQTILKGMYESPTSPEDIIKKSDQLYEKEGIDPFLRILKDEDPESFERLHENDHYRVRRAVEHFWTTGKPFSAAKEEMKDRLKQAPPKIYGWDVFHIYLDIDKPKHWQIIEERARSMYQNGLLEEVNSLLAQGFSGEEKPLKSIGYKQAVGLINGEFSTQEEAIERTVIATRQLAKAQRTWFAKVEKNSYNRLEDLNKIHHDVSEFIG